MIGLRGKLPAKPGGANGRRILIARAVRRKRFVSDGHEVVGRFATRSAPGKHIFANRAFGLKTHVLQDDGVVHDSRPFFAKGSRKLDLGASLEKGGIERATNAATSMMTHLHPRGYAILQVIRRGSKVVVHFYCA